MSSTRNDPEYEVALGALELAHRWQIHDVVTCLAEIQCDKLARAMNTPADYGHNNLYSEEPGRDPQTVFLFFPGVKGWCCLGGIPEACHWNPSVKVFCWGLKKGSEMFPEQAQRLVSRKFGPVHSRHYSNGDLVSGRSSL